VTNASAAAYGPVIVGSSDSDGFGPAFVNWGGCQANVDGDASPGGCGNQTNDWQACSAAVCPDVQCGADVTACDEYAAETTCAGLTETPSCAGEWSSAESGVPPCAYFATLLSLWCGP
jgi:hypothetical protein